MVAPTRRRVAVTGLGVVSALGHGPREFWAALCAGRVGTGEVTLFDTTGCLTHRAGQIHGWDAGTLTRSESFALAAADQALRQGGLLDAAGQPRPAYPPERVGVAVGLVMGNRPGVEPWVRARHTTAGATPPGTSLPSHPSPPPGTPVTAHRPDRVSLGVARRYGLAGPHLVVPTACAAGNSALAQAADAIVAGRADAMLAGGADELSEAMFLMFTSFRALAPDTVQPFGAGRRGLMLGEGAALLLLEDERRARARGARPLALLAGHGGYSDAHHMTAPHPEGRGAVRSMRAALGRAGLGPADVDLVSAHGTGTPANDAVEARALREVFGTHTDALPVTAVKAMLGHAQGAAGAIGAVCCVLAIQHGTVPPIPTVRQPDPGCALDLVLGGPRHTRVRAAVNNAFGFGGNNCCTVLTAP